jgi:hypothetical protein
VPTNQGRHAAHVIVGQLGELKLTGGNGVEEGCLGIWAYWGLQQPADLYENRAGNDEGSPLLLEKVQATGVVIVFPV